MNMGERSAESDDDDDDHDHDDDDDRGLYRRRQGVESGARQSLRARNESAECARRPVTYHIVCTTHYPDTQYSESNARGRCAEEMRRWALRNYECSAGHTEFNQLKREITGTHNGGRYYYMAPSHNIWSK